MWPHSCLHQVRSQEDEGEEENQQSTVWGDFLFWGEVILSSCECTDVIVLDRRHYSSRRMRTAAEVHRDELRAITHRMIDSLICFHLADTECHRRYFKHWEQTQISNIAVWSTEVLSYLVTLFFEFLTHLYSTNKLCLQSHSSCEGRLTLFWCVKVMGQLWIFVGERA